MVSYVKFTIILELGIQGIYNLSANSALTEVSRSLWILLQILPLLLMWINFLYYWALRKLYRRSRGIDLGPLPLMEKNQILGQISANRIVQEIRDAMLVTHYQKYILNYIYLLIMVSILFMFRWDFNLPEPQLLARIIIRLSFFFASWDYLRIRIGGSLSESLQSNLPLILIPQRV